MRTMFIILSIVIVSNYAITGQTKNTTKGNAEITFITNCGFLVQVGDKKVIFDIESPKTAFDKASLLKAYDLMNKNKSPFNDVDLVMISHPHDDHLGKKEITEYLKMNKKVKLISTIDTRDELKKADSVSFTELAQNIFTLDPYDKRESDIDYNGIKIESIGMYHFGAPNYVLKDLSFIIEINGIRIFFLSDVDLSYEKNLTALKEWSKRKGKIDILFSCDVNLFINDYSKNGPNVIKEYINPKNVIAMHFDPKKVEETEKNVKAFFPNTILFKKSLEKKIIDITGTK